jgi:hypothetical protein
MRRRIPDICQDFTLSPEPETMTAAPDPLDALIIAVQKIDLT